MTVESTYRYLIERAEREGEPELAQQLREWAFEKYDIDLLNHGQ